jgi:regulator of RNase E activity RraA
MTISSETLKKLTSYDTPTISNVIEVFDVCPRNRGYMDGRIQAAFPEMAPTVGFAVTTAFRADAPPVDGGTYCSFKEQLELFAAQPGPAMMVFQDLDDPAVAATFGEVMCSTYQAFGAAGLITSGGGRDLEQVRALGFPVFTGGTICSHGYGQWLHVGLPVRVGGLIVETGNLLHADANGVTNIPLEIASEIVDVAPEYIAAEELVIGYNKAPGEKNIAELVERATACKATIAEIQRRVSRAK